MRNEPIQGGSPTLTGAQTRCLLLDAGHFHVDTTVGCQAGNQLGAVALGALHHRLAFAPAGGTHIAGRQALCEGGGLANVTIVERL